MSGWVLWESFTASPDGHVAGVMIGTGLLVGIAWGLHRAYRAMSGRISGPGFPKRDADLVECRYCRREVARGDLYGLVTARAVYLNICGQCADHAGPSTVRVDEGEDQ